MKNRPIELSGRGVGDVMGQNESIDTTVPMLVTLDMLD